MTADVAILGGGPAGSTAASALVRAGADVVVIERSCYDRVRSGEILPARVRVPLTELGLWERFQTLGAVASAGIAAAWGQPEVSVQDSIFDPYGTGWHVDRQALDRMLATAAEESGAVIYPGARLRQWQHDSRGWRLNATLDDRTVSLRAHFLIDATGRSSILTRWMGVPRVRYDRLVGILGLIRTESAGLRGAAHALIESRPFGWWYSAALPGQRVVAGYLTDAEQLASSQKRPDRLWRDQLWAAPFTGDAVGPIVNAAVKVRVVTAATQRRQRFAGHRWLAIGDAAIALDPLSGHGVLHALENGLAATHALTGSDRPRGLAEYAAAQEQQFADQMRLRAWYYGLETRWPQSPFWKCRQLTEIANIREGG
jgi:flavin-dependent dehydrogenase